MKKALEKSLLFIAFWVGSVSFLHAQMVVSGTVTDSDGFPAAEAYVRVDGFSEVVTDFDGNYVLQVTADQATGGSVNLTAEGITGETASTSIAFANGENRTQDFQLGAIQLQQVVAIGYGTAKKEDVTGAADLVSAEDFNKGPITSPQQLISGKVAGVSISSNGGAPGGDSNINIRGIGSLTLESNPLFVIDGVPIDGGVGGGRNPLNMINPNDIASMSVLKDASASAIYGSRGANGVIIITTKKGKNKGFKFNFNNATSVAQITGKVDVLGADKFREIINGTGNATAIGLLGNANTDWQDEIYKTALGTDNSFSAMGNAFGVPMRASLGYTNQDGVLRGDNLERYTGSLNFSPKLLDGDLRLDLNARGMYTENIFANQGAIGAAVSFDPTQSVYNADGSYFTWIDPATGRQYNLATTNPMALLNLSEDTSEVRRFIGNAKIDYVLPFFRDVTLTVNGGFDKTNSHGRTIVSENMPSADTDWDGSLYRYINRTTNKLFDVYANYNKEVGDHSFGLMVGHSYQSFEYDNYSYNSELEEEGNKYEFFDPSRNTMLSYFGRLNYSYQGKYLLTATLRADASSKLNPDDRWGYFPSAALAWNMHKEDFMKDGFFNEFKLRLGYGEVGNVNGLGDYQFLTRYSVSTSTAQYQFGSQFYNTYRPDPLNKELKWEIGNTLNAGIDFAFLNKRVKGSFNAYIKKTKDLIAKVAVDPFTNFGNYIDKNIGDMENKGLEFSVNVVPVKTENLVWSIDYNISYNDNKITKIPAPITVGGISGGTGNTVQLHKEGEAPYSFYVYEQVYDSNNKPIEGAFVDRNNDGVINSDDRYIYKDPYADVFMGLSTNVSYKNWDLSVATRASLGNYVYNNVASNNGYLNRALPNGGNFLSNIHTDYLNSGFDYITETELQSDYYVQNASFFKVDNITLGYTFGDKIFKNMSLRLYSSLQNVATITDYDGLDPEVVGGIDNNFYPRPRTFVLGLNLDF